MCFTKMAVLPDVAGVCAVACDPILLDRAFTAVLAGVWPLTRIHELAVVQGDFPDHSLGVDHVARLNSLIVHSYLAHASH